MGIRTKREATVLGFAVCLAATAVLVMDQPGRPSAVRVRETSVVGSLGEPLAGFFDGLPTDPRYDPGLVRLMNRLPASRRCGETLLDKLLGLMESTAYAQNSCSATACAGNNWYNIQSNCGCGTYANTAHDSQQAPYYSGFAYDGNFGCPSCPASGICENSACGDQCTNNSGCDIGEWCNNGACVVSACGNQPTCRLDTDCPADTAWTCNAGCCDCGPGGYMCSVGAGGDWFCGLALNSNFTCQGGCCASGGSCDAVGKGKFGALDCGGDGGSGGDNPCPGGEYPCDEGDHDNSCLYYTCEDGPYGSDYCCLPYDPILIDVNGDGYSLTSPSNGVLFDMAGNGNKTQISWTSAGADDAFLALDRNGNGRIDNGTELFSNFSPNAKSGSGGYNALAFYDQPANGGNGDGWIDAKDAVFSKLLLWVDRNHNGISDRGELFTLPQLGITAISLDYKESKRTDAYGNLFHYRAKVIRSGPGAGKDHWAYDVFLHAKQ